MTCFWNSLLAGIPKDFYGYGEHIIQPIHLVDYLKRRNCKTDHVKFNGCFLSEQRKQENLEAISCFQSGSIYGGYFCAFEEPFLFLVSEIFKINIKHIYNRHIAEYIYEENGVKSNKCLHLQSSSSHMNLVCFKNG